MLRGAGRVGSPINLGRGKLARFRNPVDLSFDSHERYRMFFSFFLSFFSLCNFFIAFCLGKEEGGGGGKRLRCAFSEIPGMRSYHGVCQRTRQPSVIDPFWSHDERRNNLVLNY